MAALVSGQLYLHNTSNLKQHTEKSFFLFVLYHFLCSFFKKNADKSSFYDLVDKDMHGNEVKMESFKGNVLCVVNVASKWGLTKSNYVQFSKLHDTYETQGLKILAFPCNQFGAQEPVGVNLFRSMDFDFLFISRLVWVLLFVKLCIY